MKTAIQTTKAPQAIGPYSQGIKVGQLVFLSGQIPLNPETMQIVGNTVEDQTEQVMKNLRAVLEQEGLTLQHVVKTTIFLTSMADFPQVNAVYEKFFEAPFPARATIAVVGLPKGSLVEIEAIACIG
jgi:2-iminobutanoate/2-iminopropanoate deaminase